PGGPSRRWRSWRPAGRRGWRLRSHRVRRRRPRCQIPMARLALRFRLYASIMTAIDAAYFITRREPRFPSRIRGPTRLWPCRPSRGTVRDVAVGDRHPAVAAEGPGCDLYPRRRLPALVLAAV